MLISEWNSLFFWTHLFVLYLEMFINLVIIYLFVMFSHKNVQVIYVGEDILPASWSGKMPKTVLKTARLVSCDALSSSRQRPLIIFLVISYWFTYLWKLNFRWSSFWTVFFPSPWRHNKLQLLNCPLEGNRGDFYSPLVLREPQAVCYFILHSFLGIKQLRRCKVNTRKGYYATLNYNTFNGL